MKIVQGAQIRNEFQKGMLYIYDGMHGPCVFTWIIDLYADRVF